MTKHPIYGVGSFQLLAPYTLRVQFDDHTEQVINFEPVLAGELYRPLRDSALFNRVKIDPEVHTFVWPNGADFDPETLHDWPNQADAIASRARQWETIPNCIDGHMAGGSTTGSVAAVARIIRLASSSINQIEICDVFVN